MNTRYEGSMKVLSPSDNKYLTNGEAYTDGEVYMKYDADDSAWIETDSMPEPPESDEPISDTEALNIIIGNE